MKVQKRRRRECKTDYLKRIKLLKSGKPRIVFRRSNKYILAQYVTSKHAQDSIVFTLNSRQLLDKGFPKEFSGSLKSIPASYLLGFWTGKTVQTDKLETPILDTGMLQTIYKTKIFAFIKGLIDAGLEINCKDEAFPSEESIQGKKLKQDFSSNFNKIKENLEKL